MFRKRRRLKRVLAVNCRLGIIVKLLRNTDSSIGIRMVSIAKSSVASGHFTRFRKGKKNNEMLQGQRRKKRTLTGCGVSIPSHPLNFFERLVLGIDLQLTGNDRALIKVDNTGNNTALWSIESHLENLALFHFTVVFSSSTKFRYQKNAAVFPMFNKVSDIQDNSEIDRDVSPVRQNNNENTLGFSPTIFGQVGVRATFCFENDYRFHVKKKVGFNYLDRFSRLNMPDDAISRGEKTI